MVAVTRAAQPARPECFLSGPFQKSLLTPSRRRADLHRGQCWAGANGPGKTPRAGPAVDGAAGEGPSAEVTSAQHLQNETANRARFQGRRSSTAEARRRPLGRFRNKMGKPGKPRCRFGGRFVAGSDEGRVGRAGPGREERFSSNYNGHRFQEGKTPMVK